MRGRRLGRGEASSLACWWSANGIQWELWWVANWFQCEFWALCRMLASCVMFASNVGCSRTFVGPCGPKFFVFGLLVSRKLVSMTFVGPCGPKFFVFGLLVSRKLVSMTGVLTRRSEVSMSGRLCAGGGFVLDPFLRFRFFESCRLKVHPAVRTGAFRTDFVASRRCVFDGFLQDF